MNIDMQNLKEIKTQVNENQLETRAYQMISEMTLYLQDIGINDKNKSIINELAGYMADCLFVSF